MTEQLRAKTEGKIEASTQTKNKVKEKSIQTDDVQFGDVDNAMGEAAGQGIILDQQTEMSTQYGMNLM